MKLFLKREGVRSVSSSPNVISEFWRTVLLHSGIQQTRTHYDTDTDTDTSAVGVSDMILYYIIFYYTASGSSDLSC